MLSQNHRLIRSVSIVLQNVSLCQINQLHLVAVFRSPTVCCKKNTALLVGVCKSTGRMASCVQATLLAVSFIQHSEPAGLCVRTSITASAKTLMVCCHWPQRAMPSIPDEDEVNRKSIGLWHWQPQAQRAQAECLRKTTHTFTCSCFCSLSFNESKCDMFLHCLQGNYSFVGKLADFHKMCGKSPVITSYACCNNAKSVLLSCKFWLKVFDSYIHQNETEHEKIHLFQVRFLSTYYEKLIWQ